MKSSRHIVKVLLLIDLDYSWYFLEGGAADGLDVHAIGIDSFRNSVASFNICSQHWLPADAFHAPNVLPVLRSLLTSAELAGHRLILVTLRERSVKMAAELAALTGCEGLSVRTATLFRDKWEMAQAAMSLGIPTPDTWLASSPEIVNDFPSVGVMIKPRRGSVSLGLHTCPDRVALHACIQDLQDPSTYIGQTYVDGPMYFVDAVVRDGQTRCLMIGKHLVPLGQVGRGSRAFLRSWATVFDPTHGVDSDVGIYRILAQYHDTIARGFGLVDGCTHMEFFSAGGQVLFCEAAVRPGGPRILAMQRCLWGLTMPALFAMTLRQAPPMQLPPARKGWVGMIDFVAEAPVRTCGFIHSLNADWVLDVVDWDPALVDGGHYTAPLKRILIASPNEAACEQRLQWLADGFQYALR